MKFQESGQALILFVLMITTFTGVVALTVDVGRAFREKSNDQMIADASALAAVEDLIGGGSNTHASTEARNYGTKNGLTDAINQEKVTIPPDNGPSAGKAGCAEVEVGTGISGLFSNVLGVTGFDIGARTVACATAGFGNYAIITLNPTACTSVDLVGNVTINVPNAGIFVNSTCSANAWRANGNVVIHTNRNDVRGGCQNIGGAVVTPTCTHPANPLPDPLASLPVPTPPTNVRTCPTLNGNGSYTFQPGRYNCAINPNGNWTLTFAAGNYHITGGINLNRGSVTMGAGQYTLGGVGFQVSGNTSITGTGVMFYVTAGGINLHGTSGLAFSPPTSGVYKGITFFQSRTLATDLNLNGNASAGDSGVVYAPAARATYSGNVSTSYQWIVDRFATNGTTGSTINFNGIQTAGSPSIKITE